MTPHTSYSYCNSNFLTGYLLELNIRTFGKNQTQLSGTGLQTLGRRPPSQSSMVKPKMRPMHPSLPQTCLRRSPASPCRPAQRDGSVAGASATLNLNTLQSASASNAKCILHLLTSLCSLPFCTTICCRDRSAVHIWHPILSVLLQGLWAQFERGPKPWTWNALCGGQAQKRKRLTPAQLRLQQKDQALLCRQHGFASIVRTHGKEAVISIWKIVIGFDQILMSLGNPKTNLPM